MLCAKNIFVMVNEYHSQLMPFLLEVIWHVCRRVDPFSTLWGYWPKIAKNRLKITKIGLHLVNFGGISPVIYAYDCLKSFISYFPLFEMWLHYFLRIILMLHLIVNMMNTARSLSLMCLSLGNPYGFIVQSLNGVTTATHYMYYFMISEIY